MENNYLNKYINFFNKYGFIKINKIKNQGPSHWLILFNKKYNIYLILYKTGYIRLNKYWPGFCLDRWEPYQLNNKNKINNKLGQLKYLANYIINNKKYNFN